MVDQSNAWASRTCRARADFGLVAIVFVGLQASLITGRESCARQGRMTLASIAPQNSFPQFRDPRYLFTIITEPPESPSVLYQGD